MFENENVVELDTCLACGSRALELNLDLGSQPLANSYKLNKDDVQEEYPLAINHCKNCHHIQLTHAVNPDLMYKDYLYVSGTSSTMNEHCKWFAEYALEYFDVATMRKAYEVLDIGCNDGTQLNYFKDKGCSTFGVDPAENLEAVSSKKHKIWVDYFGRKFANSIHKHFDIIVAQNVFAHNYDPLEFLLSASKLMATKSLLFIQTSQADMIKNNEFDTIYHEHISFYNINSMNELVKRAGLFLIDVIKTPLHGNSYIFVISKHDLRPANVKNLIDMERKAGLYDDETYLDYSANCTDIIEDLATIISTMKATRPDRKYIGYGAAAKGMTLLNAAKIKLDYIIDDNPLKQGRFTPGTSIPIVPCSILSELKDTDEVCFVPLAWNFFSEIRAKIKNVRDCKNDQFVMYFPRIKVVK